MYTFTEGEAKFDPNIDVKTLKAIQSEAEGAQLFDVRNPEELEFDGKFPGAVNIPRKSTYCFFWVWHLVKLVIWAYVCFNPFLSYS